MLSFERAGEILTVEYAIGWRRFPMAQAVGNNVRRISPEQLPRGGFVKIYSTVSGSEEVLLGLLVEGTVMAAYTPTPAPTPTPTIPPRPPRPAPTPITVLASVAGYSPLLAQAMSSLPAEHDLVRDGISSEERRILDWADSRLFGNSAFLESEFSPDSWPSDVRIAMVQSIPLLMLEIDIQKRADRQHVVSWGVDSLDRVLDDLGIYPGMCVYCYGKSGYESIDDEIGDNYVPIIRSQGHVHREMLKTFAYLAKADGQGILVRSLLENGPDDFELLYKRRLDNYPVTIGVGSFAYENVSFMSQIRLPEGRLVSLPTMAFGMVGDAGTEREAVERVFDHVRKNLIHDTGDHDDAANLFRPYTVTPYSPELGWILYVGEAGSPSSAALLTGAFRAVGLKAEQFRTPRTIINAGSVEVDGETYYYDGNDPFGRNLKKGPICTYFRTFEQVENQEYDRECDK